MATGARATARTTCLGVLLVVLVLSGCSAAGGELGSWQDVRDSLSNGDFAVTPGSLSDMREDVDLVVIGRLDGEIATRTIDPAGDGGVTYQQLELVVDAVVSGPARVGDRILFEGWGDDVETPDERALFFLVEKVSDVDPAGIFTWHTSRGIWVETDEGVATPLNGDPPQQDPLYADDLAGVRSLDELAARIR